MPYFFSFLLKCFIFTNISTDYLTQSNNFMLKYAIFTNISTNNRHAYLATLCRCSYLTVFDDCLLFVVGSC